MAADVHPEMAVFCAEVLTTSGFDLATMTTKSGAGPSDAAAVLTLMASLDDDGAAIVVAHLMDNAR